MLAQGRARREQKKENAVRDGLNVAVVAATLLALLLQRAGGYADVLLFAVAWLL